MHTLKRPVQIYVSLIATAVLLTLLWVTWQIVEQPDLGLLWTNHGEVYYAKQNSTLQVGDRIATIDTVPLQASSFPYYRWKKGDIIQLEVVRQSETIFLNVPYENRAPLVVLSLRLSIIIVALTLWAISTIVALFSASRVDQGILFFLWCQLMAASLALGNVTSLDWAAHVSLVLTWWVVPLAIHFHLLFPLDRITSKPGKFFLLAYAVPFIGTSRLLVAGNLITFSNTFARLYPLLFYSWVLFGLLIVLALLARSYLKAPSPAVKRQVGLLVVCGFLALAPLLTLSIIPQLLLGRWLISPEITFVFLVIIPIGYGYAITRYEFIKLERYVSRSATIVLVIGLLCSFYFVITGIIHALLQQSLLASPLYNLAAIIVLVIAYNPLNRRLQRWVDYLLYGGWYDYSSVVGEVTHTLEKTTGIEALAETLSNSIQKTMRVHWACLLLPAKAKMQSVMGLSGQPDTLAIFDQMQLQNIQTILTYLKESDRPITSQELQQRIPVKQLLPDEVRLLAHDPWWLWVPIRGRSTSIGVLILGTKYGGDSFDAADMDILVVVSRQTSTAFQNVQLIAELEEKAQENEQYQRQIVWTKEEERKRISRELHDQFIQPLIGVKYQFAHVQADLDLQRQYPDKSEKVVQLQQAIGDLIQTARSLCHDLRPPALDLGLIPSIRSVVSSFEMQANIEAALVVEGDRSIAIGEEVALCLFRCTSEALNNIMKHAEARYVNVQLCIEPTAVHLTIQDNGRGFVVPERLGKLMAENHFGLVGIRERIELVNGTFHVVSAPEQGTRLHACIPLN
jgi:signal transduction histidine kinase